MKQFFIIVSAYNNSDTIELFLESLINQRFKDWKLYIADDFSQDNTAELIKNKIKFDSRIKLFRNKENLGLTKSLIKLISYVPEDGIIIRMDTDEVHKTNYLSYVLPKYLNTKCDLFLLTNKKIYKHLLNIFSPILKSLFLSLWGNIFFHGSTIYSKKLYEQSGGYLEHIYFAQDHILWMKMLFHAKKIYISSSKDLRVSQLKNLNSISKNKNIDQSIFSFYAIKEFIDLTINSDRNYIKKSLFYFFILVFLFLRPIRFFVNKLI